MERYFFNTFGYHILNVGQKKDLIPIFEEDISRALGLKNIGSDVPYSNVNGRACGLRNATFFSDKIFDIFYNQQVLDEIY